MNLNQTTWSLIVLLWFFFFQHFHINDTFIKDSVLLLEKCSLRKTCEYGLIRISQLIMMLPKLCSFTTILEIWFNELEFSLLACLLLSFCYCLFFFNLSLPFYQLSIKLLKKIKILWKLIGMPFLSQSYLCKISLRPITYIRLFANNKFTLGQ